MRNATRNPPKMLMAATVAARKARVETTHDSFPICSSAPTRMIPLMALVVAMSGVCSEWLTLEMT